MLVSICIPCFEDLSKLRRAVNSILIQENVSVEIIISDDSSTEDIREYILRLDDKRIKYFKNTSNLNSTSNWNNALSKASGEVLILLHHDDYFLIPTALCRILLEFEDPTVNVVWSRYIIEKGLYRRFYSGKFCLLLLKRFPNMLFSINYLSTPSCMALRQNVSERYNEELKWFVDVEFYSRCIRLYKNVSLIQESLIGIGADENRISSTIDRRVIDREVEKLPVTARLQVKNDIVAAVAKGMIVSAQAFCYFYNKWFKP